MTDFDSLDEIICPIIEADDGFALQQVVDSLGSNNVLNSWLIYASSLGSIECMRVLLGAGADVDYQTDNGESPFSHACSSNQLDAARLLYDEGAQINTVVCGASPLDIAVCWASPEFRIWLKSVGGIRKQEFEEWSWPPPSN